MKDDEGIVLYLLWYDHRPLRIVNVADCECHRLWDIGDWEGRASRKRSLGERKGKGRGIEDGRRQERRALGGRATGKLINAQENYVGLAEITFRDCNTSIKIAKRSRCSSTRHTDYVSRQT